MDNFFLLILPIIFSLTGVLLVKFPPKKINWVYGYRTNRSKQNSSAWKAGNQYFGKLIYGLGVIYSIIGIIFIILSYRYVLNLMPIILWSYFIEILSLIVIIIKTEKYLKKLF